MDNLCFKQFDLPGGPVIKNLPVSAWDTGLTPGWGGVHTPEGQLIAHGTATECALQPMLHREELMQWEAGAHRQRVALARSN